MEIEELFCKRYPEYSVNGKPLHPYFDVFEEGYEQAEKENEELKRDKEDLIFVRNQKATHICELKDQLSKAKEIIENIIRVTWGEGWNYSLDWKVKAEQFLKEIEK